MKEPGNPPPPLTPPPSFPPRKPRLSLPAGSVDSHLHLFGPAERYAFAPDAKYVSGDATDDLYFKVQASSDFRRGSW